MVGLDVYPAADPDEFPTDDDIKSMSPVEQIDRIIEWFDHNFEDAAENTPYESAEGGYQFIWGGPCEPLEELGDRFSDLPQRTLEAAAEKRDDTLWVPHSRRIRPEYDPEDEASSPLLPTGPASDGEWRQAISNKLDLLQAEIDTLRGLGDAKRNSEEAERGIGDNNPPESMDGEDAPSLIEIQKAISETREDIHNPDVEVARVRQRGKRFAMIAGAIANYLAKKGDGIVDSVLKNPVLQFAIYSNWNTIQGHVFDLTQMLANWAHHLSLPF